MKLEVDTRINSKLSLPNLQVSKAKVPNGLFTLVIVDYPLTKHHE